MKDQYLSVSPLQRSRNEAISGRRKPGLHISCEDRKHFFANMFFSYSDMARSPYVVIITSIHLLQEILATDILTALKSSLEHGHKSVLRLLQL